VVLVDVEVVDVAVVVELVDVLVVVPDGPDHEGAAGCTSQLGASGGVGVPCGTEGAGPGGSAGCGGGTAGTL
jgi:hypothetical protein